MEQDRRAWELFLRTGLPQAYSFARAVERERKRAERQRHERTAGER